MHAMLDFETLGNATDTIVVSLGVIAFNKDGIAGEKLFTFDLEDQVRAGRTFTASTLSWWMRQKDQARAVFQPDGTQLKHAKFFEEFENFIDQSLRKVGEGRDQLKIWGNGANFDVAILEHFYRNSHPDHENALPWKFWNVMCFRTFNDLTNCKNLVARPHGTYHSALEDARYQYKCVEAFWKKQAKKKEATK